MENPFRNRIFFQRGLSLGLMKHSVVTKGSSGYGLIEKLLVEDPQQHTFSLCPQFFDGAG